MKKTIVVYPSLFAVFPILALYAQNADELSLSVIVLPLAVALGFAALLLLFSWFLLRDINKAGLVVSVFVALFFLYGYAVNAVGLIEGWGVSSAHIVSLLVGTPGRYIVIALIWIILVVVSAYLIRRTRIRLRNATRILNVMGIVLVIIPMINIAVWEISGASKDIRVANGIEVTQQIPERPPDIYYIILERYASASTLQELYDFDNREFTDYLVSKGFYVASESSANYFSTTQSLASSLNMVYLDELSEEVGKMTTDQGPLLHMLQDYKVWRVLKSVGYKFIHFGGWWEPTRVNVNADINYPTTRLDEFSYTLVRNTPLYPLLQLWIWKGNQMWEMERNKFDRLAETTQIEGPKFVFLHWFVTHYPYMFDRNGNWVESKGKSTKALYVDSIIYTNSQLTELVDKLLSGSQAAPIIILQADEGPLPEGGDWTFWKWNEATDAELREKLSILNAYYLPGVDSSALYPSITSVNSFRVIFNLYFGAELELLPDRSYIFYQNQPYNFLDVTDTVKYHENP